ncbi:MAG: hypothetical protein WAX80_02670 [Minisyncoccia bacterium]
MKLLDFGKKLGALGAVVTVIEGSNQLFDYVLYPTVILWLGTIKGGIAMTVLALVMNYIIVVWYNRTQHDWFGLEWLRLQETIEAQTFFGKILRKLLYIGRWPAYIGISIYDPAYGFIFLRGRKSEGINLNRADWFWFIVSNLIGNLVWILIISGAIETIKHLFI